MYFKKKLREPYTIKALTYYVMALAVVFSLNSPQIEPATLWIWGIGGIILFFGLLRLDSKPRPDIANFKKEKIALGAMTIVYALLWVLTHKNDLSVTGFAPFVITTFIIGVAYLVALKTTKA